RCLGPLAKIGSPVEEALLAKVLANTTALAEFTAPNGRSNIYYTRKLSGFVQILDFVPSITDSRGRQREPSELKVIAFKTRAERDVFLSILNATFFYWCLTVFSDCRNLNKREVHGVPFDLRKARRAIVGQLGQLAGTLMKDVRAHSQLLTMNYKKYGKLTIQCTYPKHSKSIIDEIDRVLARHYGFTDEELDLILNYDIKYRMGGSGEQS
ncbi:MAG: SAM-dependent methyltransferase, partial [Dehalococcoidia bacterium]